MKKVLISLFAVAAMVSCAQNDIIELNQEEINFSNAFIENTTKAIDSSYSTEALTQFKVWGVVDGKDANGNLAKVEVFKNNTVEGTVGANSVWNVTDRTQYWVPGAKYNFAAVVNGGVDANFTLENCLPTEVKFTSDGATDLLYARSATDIVGKASGNDKVAFIFDHMLARAQFTVENTTNNSNANNSGYYYKVTDVKINDAYTFGKCTFATKAWSEKDIQSDVLFGNVTNVSDKANVGDTDAIKVADRQTATTHYWRMLIPNAYDDLEVTFTYELYAPGDVLVVKETVNRTVDVEFVAGHSYNFNIKMGVGEPIQFTVATAPTWTDATGEPDINL